MPKITVDLKWKKTVKNNFLKQERSNMKMAICFTGIIFTGLFLSACYFRGDAGGFDSSLIVAASETDLTSNKSASDRRRTNSSYSGDCEDDKKCTKICEDVYDDSGDEENEGKVQTCLELKYKIAIQFEDILEVLEEPYESTLRNIDDKAFFEFLDVSLDPWVRSTKSASSSQAKDLLIWIAKEPKISSAIIDAYKNYEKEYDKFEGVENLFEKTNCGSTIAGSSITYVDIACEKGNSNALAIYDEVCSMHSCPQ